LKEISVGRGYALKRQLLKNKVFNIGYGSLVLERTAYWHFLTSYTLYEQFFLKSSHSCFSAMVG
jgi:hypothetical protein